jgi:hypothetical protein
MPFERCWGDVGEPSFQQAFLVVYYDEFAQAGRLTGSRIAQNG